MNDEFDLYKNMVFLETTRTAVLERLDKFSWIKDPNVIFPKEFGNSLKRRASVLTSCDIAELKFANDHLVGVKIEGQLFDATSCFGSKWEALKTCFRRQIGKQGKSESRGTRPLDQRCTWQKDDLEFTLRILQDWKKATVWLDVARVAVEGRESHRSFEEFFVY